MKTCSKCKVTKSVNDFPVNKRYKEGRSTWCKSCHLEAGRAHYISKKTLEKAEKKRKPRNPRIDLTGRIFGYLTVIEWHRKTEKVGGWICLCKCGNTHFAKTYLLNSKQVTSCGCRIADINKEKFTKHGLSNTKVFKCWLSMIQRCENKNDPSYKNYGGRGIKVCKRWMDSFDAFLSDIGPRPEGLTIERKNVNGDYEPSNCCWDTRKAQSRNTRRNRKITYNGETMCVADWAEKLGFSQAFLLRRMNVQGMSFEEAISKPKRYKVWRKSLDKSLGLSV